MTPRSSDTDACPGALRLHAAADGMLARVRLPGGMLSGAQLRALRELAEEFGDGLLELTSRANLQLRALKEGDSPALTARLRSAGLLPSMTHDNVRNIAAPPLPGAGIRALVERLDLAIQADAALAGLPGKFLFAVGRVPLAADVAAVPAGPAPARLAGPAQRSAAAPAPVSGPGPGGLFAIRFAGHDTGLRAGFDEVVPALISAAHAFLAERAAQRGDGPAAWRLRELTDGPARVSARVATALGRTTVPVPAAVPVGDPQPGDLIGLLPQEDGLAAVAALVPLGRLSGVPMKVLEDADLLVVTPWRGIVVADVPPEAAPAWADRLSGAGLAVSPGSPWTGVTACAGRPGCAKSLADVRADATTTARFVDGLPVHWAGCARACGSPAGRHVRVEATGDGYLITRRTVTGDDPGVHIPAGQPTGGSRPAAGTPRPAAGTSRPAAGESGPVGPSTRAAGSPRIGHADPFPADTGTDRPVTDGLVNARAEADQPLTDGLVADARSLGRTGTVGPVAVAASVPAGDGLDPGRPRARGPKDPAPAQRWADVLQDAVAVARRP
jgi:precorrin-3B synthase